MKRTKKLFTVTDLGGGDGGKGGVVHKICDAMHAHTVIKVGGAQGSHGVRTSSGEQFNFSQFGCGTFNGARTYVSHRFVMDPNGILNEGQLLRHELGIREAFDLITVDEDALCITPYHGIASRLRELARRDTPRGTVGVGVGVAYRDAESMPGLALYAKDMARPDLRDRIANIRLQKLVELESVIDAGFSDDDRGLADREIDLLADPGLVDWTVERFRLAAKEVRLRDRDYLAREILAKDGTVVVESSHGVLTDRYHGFHPHTSALRTLPRFTHEMLRAASYDGTVVNLGVTRAYQIRHGAGPMPTESREMVQRLLPGSNKGENRYQGGVRVGPLDFVALRYAIAVCGGVSAFDALAITWFDQIQANEEWRVCNRYEGMRDQFFLPSGEIRVRRDEDDSQLAYQQMLGNHLQTLRPVISTYPVSQAAPQDDLVGFVASVVKSSTSLPVSMISFGPTEKEKVLL